MKNVILLAAILVITFTASAQTLAPKGLKVGKTPDAIIVTKITSDGQNIKFYAGNQLLSPEDPDTIDFESVGVLRKDSVSAYNGSYTTRYDFKNEYTNHDLVKGLNEIGYGIKYLPFAGFAMGSGNTLVDGRQYFTSYRITDTTLLTGVKFSTTQQGSYTPDNTNSIALYKWNQTSWDKVAETANEGTLWSAVAGSVSAKTFTTPYVATPGWYYIALLYNSSAQTTAPITISMTTYQGWFAELGSFKLTGTRDTQSSHASNVTNAQITRNTIPFFVIIY